MIVPVVLMCLSVQAGVETDRIQALIIEGKLRQALSLTDKQLQGGRGQWHLPFPERFDPDAS